MQRYEEIFEQRGKSYHQAMEDYPNARDEEFRLAVSFLKAFSKSTILDIPAGGGYLQQYLPKSINYLAYDFSGEFDDNHTGIKKCKESSIDLPNHTVDEVVTLAALHHVVERQAFFSEMHRLLKPGGQLIIADVVAGSKVDHFLNGFLNDWNSMGHKGVFLDLESDAKKLEQVGFDVEIKTCDFNWNFKSATDAQAFFRKLFFLDLSPSDELLEEALIQLGVTEDEGRYQVNWSLGVMVARKKT